MVMQATLAFLGQAYMLTCISHIINGTKGTTT